MFNLSHTFDNICNNSEISVGSCRIAPENFAVNVPVNPEKLLIIDVKPSKAPVSMRSETRLHLTQKTKHL